MRILSTKKLSSSEKNQFIVNGLELLQYDFISVSLEKFVIDENINYDYLIFTSQNAVRSVLKSPFFSYLKNKKVFCVGENTKFLLENSGWEVLEYAFYAEELAQIISQEYFKYSFLFFCGNLRRDTIPQMMQKKNIEFTEIQVYKNEKTPVKISENIDGILFFSPSGVESFLEKNLIINQKLFCIGTTTAQSLSAYAKNCIIAETPTIKSTIDSCIKYYLNI